MIIKNLLCTYLRNTMYAVVHLLCVLVILQESDGYSSVTAGSQRAKIKMLIQDLYYDAEMKVQKVGFIKKWAYHGNPAPARVAELIFNTKLMYTRMVKLYLSTVDKVSATTKPLTMYQTFQRLFICKRLAMQIENMAYVVLEYDRYDPSGKLYGRSGPASMAVYDDFQNHKHKNTSDQNVKDLKELTLKKLNLFATLRGLNTSNLMELLRSKNKDEDGFDSDKD